MSEASEKLKAYLAGLEGLPDDLETLGTEEGDPRVTFGDLRALLAERTEMREAAQEFVDGLRLIGQNSSLQMSKETRKAIGALMALKLVDLLEPYWRQARMEMPPRLPPREEP